MNGVTFNPDAIGAALACLVVVLAALYAVHRFDGHLDAEDERRLRHLDDDEIDHDYAAGE